MSTKASTAALDQMSERLSLPPRRAPRHRASGKRGQGICAVSARRTVLAQLNLNRCTTQPKGAAMIAPPDRYKDARNKLLWRTIRRRILGAALMGGLTMVVPLIAAKAPVPHHEVRLPLLDRRAIENLQRWASKENEREFESARLESCPAIVRFASNPIRTLLK